MRCPRFRNYDVPKKEVRYPVRKMYYEQRFETKIYPRHYQQRFETKIYPRHQDLHGTGEILQLKYCAQGPGLSTDSI